ncbi:MAG: glycine--tRNA ligase subunit beta [Cyanobium sp.]
MATFLLEIGTEELPADFARLSLPQVKAAVAADLSGSRIRHGRVRVTGTPRRLALSVEELAAQQGDLVEERKGPPAAQAFCDGVPTQAALGFARRCGVDPEQLEVRESGKGPFVYASILERGRPTVELLSELIPGWIWGLQGRRFMRWGEGESRFSRPVRWLVALLDSEVIELELAECDPPVRSGRHSRGHRLQPKPVAIADAGVYAATLAAVDVQVERDSRRAWIRGRLDQAAAEAGAQLDLPPALLEELVDLVESPELIEGAIDDRFLALPPEVLSTVMRAHQRYVPLVRADAPDDPLALEAGATLLPRFLCIANGRADASATIRRGNERVLRARLADAEFFLQADRGVASIDRRDQLDRVTFAEGLGSLRDRCERIEWLTDVLLAALPLEPAAAADARRAAHLCKHDLVSQMVGEFPELQGVMGGKYLLAEGESRGVALAVLEHYLPRAAGDALPGSDAGAVVALAERLELLLSIWGKGERPSGSSDPYALRRAGNGLLQILWERGWSLDLPALLQRACGHWAELFPGFRISASALSEELTEFLRQRSISMLEESGLEADLVQAVAGEGLPLDRVLGDPADARRRALLLAELRRNGELPALQAVVQRASRLAARSTLDPSVLSPAGVVDAALFHSPAEAAMLSVLEQLQPIAASCATGGGGEDPPYGELARRLAASAPTLAAFFDGDQSVLVMAEDPAVRSNRLNLLALLRNQAALLADFERISG